MNIIIIIICLLFYSPVRTLTVYKDCPHAVSWIGPIIFPYMADSSKVLLEFWMWTFDLHIILVLVNVV